MARSSNKDLTFIRGLKVKARIGVYPWEKKIRQLLIIDLSIRTPILKAAKTDNVKYAADYEAISNFIKQFGLRSHRNLVETFAEDLARALKSNFKLTSIVLRITKPGAIKEAEGVGVEIER